MAGHSYKMSIAAVDETSSEDVVAVVVGFYDAL